jgi:hypothetical protein
MFCWHVLAGALLGAAVTVVGAELAILLIEAGKSQPHAATAGVSHRTRRRSEKAHAKRE